MKSKIIISIIIIGLLLPTSLTTANVFKIETNNSKELDLDVIDNPEVFDGYTLLNPVLGKKTYLINNTNKKVVHTWKSDHRLTMASYLLENGNLVRTSAIFFNPFLWQGGCGGRIEMFDWEGNLIWDFTHMRFNKYCMHNDIEPLPNGNILAIVWEYKTRDEAIDAGCNPKKVPGLNNFILIDYIIEIKPTGPTSGDIVWEWHLWDHLIQDYDPLKDNYGVVADHPELLDINYGWWYTDVSHLNSLDYNETYDQILISSRVASEIWVIDHSTTTEEAENHTGGKYGKGGDILYRWGNPQNYHRGDEADRKLFAQHDPRWVKQGCPGEGHITIFDNGYYLNNDSSRGYSSIEEIIPPMDENGSYYLEPGSTYGPEETVWTFTAENKTDIYSETMSSAQRLPNGNTFICSGDQGHLFEVTPEKEIVWDYINPYPIYIPNYNFYIFDHLNEIFKTQCYTQDYPGLVKLSTNAESETFESEASVVEIITNCQIQEEQSISLITKSSSAYN
jgi:hypothetical protein